MKKISFIIALAICVSTGLKAQIQSTEYRPKNFIKINLTSLLLNNYMVQYERALGKTVSVAFSYRMMPSSTIPFKDFIIKQIDDPEGKATEILNSLKLSNYALTPEIRFYLGKKGYGRGFYIAPFYRYAHFEGSNLKVDYEVTDNNSNTTTYSITLDGNTKGQTVGLMFGAQWSLGKNICLDWWIIGPHIGTGNGTFNGKTSQPMTQDMQTSLRDALESFDVPMYKKTVNVNDNGATMTLDGNMAGVRAGILLGIKF